MATTTPAVGLGKISTQRMIPPHNQAALKILSDHYTSSGAITINSVIPFMRVSVDDLLVTIDLSATDHGTVGALDLTFFPALKTKKDDGSDLVVGDAIGSALIASAIDIKTAAQSQTRLRFSVLSPATEGQPVWQLAGLSSKPTTYTEVFIAGVMSTATDAAGTLTLQVLAKTT